MALDAAPTNLPTPIASETVAFGQRKCPSDADVLAVAAVGNFEEGELELNPCRALASASVSVPEPSGLFTLAMLGFGGLLLASGKKKVVINYRINH